MYIQTSQRHCCSTRTTILEPNGSGDNKITYTTAQVTNKVLCTREIVTPRGRLFRWAKAQTCHAQFPANHSASTLITQRKLNLIARYGCLYRRLMKYAFGHKKMPQSRRCNSSVCKRHINKRKRGVTGRHLSLPYRRIKSLVSPRDIEGSTR